MAGNLETINLNDNIEDDKQNGVVLQVEQDNKKKSTSDLIDAATDTNQEVNLGFFNLYTPGEPVPDVNIYQQRKTLAQGMLDLALFTANANQLRTVLDNYDTYSYFYLNIIFIILSLILQVLIGLGLIWNSVYNIRKDKDMCIAAKINNHILIGIFMITCTNVFIMAFSGDSK